MKNGRGCEKRPLLWWSRGPSVVYDDDGMTPSPEAYQRSMPLNPKGALLRSKEST